MTLQEYILRSKCDLDAFALDNRLREPQSSAEDWHQLFFEWSVRKHFMEKEKELNL